MSTKDTEYWNKGGVAEKYLLAENATRPFANNMIKSVGLDKYEGNAHVFDFACGTGSVIKELYVETPKEKWGNLKILGGDVSVPMLEYLKARGEKEGWTGLATQIVDGNNIQLNASQFTHLFISFGIFMMPSTALQTCLQLLKPNGRIAISTWAYLPWISYVKRSLELLPEEGRPAMPSENEVENILYKGRPFNEPSYISQILQEAGFEDVEVTTRENLTSVGTSDQFVETMTMPLKMVAGFWSQDDGEKDRLVKAVQEKMKGLLDEEFGKGKITKMKFKAIMGSGKRAA